MWKLLDAVKQRFGEQSPEAACPLGWIVIFPDADCPPTGTEFSRADVIDAKDFRNAIAARIKSAPSVLAAAKHRKAPSSSVVRTLSDFLRADFERVPTAASFVGPVVEHLNALTEEQYIILDSIIENDQSIVQGYAGTGKTTLAVELARRNAAQGSRTLLLCFNRVLGEWLQRRVAGFGPGEIVAGHVHHVLLARIMRSSLVTEFGRLRVDGPDYWNEKFYLFGTIAVSELGEKFDAIVIDEAQDFHIPNLIVLATEWLAANGKVVLFGDFARQAIYGTSGRQLAEARDALPGAAMFRLQKNCRNTRRIAECTAHVCELDGQAYHDRTPDGVPVSIHYYRDAENLRQSLAATIKTMTTGGIARDDIVILGSYQVEKSSLTTQAGTTGLGAVRNGPSYQTIHSFKGMESPAVIVVDIDDMEAPEILPLLYIGISRARALLHIFVHERCKPVLDARLRQVKEVKVVA